MFNRLERFVPDVLANDLEEFFLDWSINWTFARSTTDINEVNEFKNYNSKLCDRHQFTSVICEHGDILNDELWTFVKPVLYYFMDASGKEIRFINRIKANLLLPDQQHTDDFNTPHVDNHDSLTSFIYYINNSDGDTVLYGDRTQAEQFKPIDRNTPQKGTGIYFPSNLYHGSCNPVESDYRLVINFILDTGENKWQL